MATTTKNLGFIKPALDDNISIETLNGNFDSIDSEFGYFKVMFYLDSWTASGTGYTQTVTGITGLTSGMDVGPFFTEISSSDYALTAALQKGLQAMCSSKGFTVTVGNGSLTWWTTKKPERNIPLYFKRMVER